ncbi:PDDEXK nuclease domain-containing protein [Thalassoglobus sp.]|uniref:PDDEXK nuclease domain-containing protein n=1 Tax=Thalassoglobus sp. TaxID=2795869 RepID=UPI003AA90C3C
MNRKPKDEKNSSVKQTPSQADEFDFTQLVELLETTHQQSQVEANRAINRALVIRNWLFGRYIVEYEQSGADRAEYGAKLLKQLSKELKPLGRGFSGRNLASFCAFYRAFPEILQTVSAKFDPAMLPSHISQTPSALLPAEIDSEVESTLSKRFTLSWSHYVILLTLDNLEERKFYEIEANANGWSVRELDRQINSGLFQRLAVSKDKDEIRRLAQEGQVVASAADLIKNPLVLEFLDLDEKASYSEHELESEIVNKLQTFMLELGKGFLFESRQKRFTFDAKHYYVDLVLYNRLLRSYVLLDLKLGEITHGDLGQMQMYVNYFDRQVKLEDELPTIGIVLCARKNDALVELTLPDNANIFASKYQLYLPSKEELKDELEKIEAELAN